MDSLTMQEIKMHRITKTETDNCRGNNSSCLDWENSEKATRGGGDIGVGPWRLTRS